MAKPHRPPKTLGGSVMTDSELPVSPDDFEFIRNELDRAIAYYATGRIEGASLYSARGCLDRIESRVKELEEELAANKGFATQEHAKAIKHRDEKVVLRRRVEELERERDGLREALEYHSLQAHPKNVTFENLDCPLCAALQEKPE